MFAYVVKVNRANAVTSDTEKKKEIIADKLKTHVGKVGLSDYCSYMKTMMFTYIREHKNTASSISVQ